MTVEEYLSQYGDLKSRFSFDRASFAALKATLTDADAPEIMDNPVQTSPSKEAPYARDLERLYYLSGRQIPYETCPPQIRTCGLPASGSLQS